MESKELTVHDRLGPIRFKGSLLSDKRWTLSRQVRWTDMALYAVDSMAHDSHLRTTLECEGCQPARLLLVGPETIDEGAILCGICAKPFVIAERQEEQPIRYALEITARSRVYHQLGSRCVRSKHRIRKVKEVEQDTARWGELVPCRDCRPSRLSQLGPDQYIAEERDEPQIYLCISAAAVINKLYRRNGEITELAAKLLKDAAVKDLDIAEAIDSRRRI